MFQMTSVMYNIAEHGPFIDELPIKDADFPVRKLQQIRGYQKLWGVS